MSWLSSALYDHVMSLPERACLAAWRAELLAPVRGAVLEIGAGTGANASLYDPSVTDLVLLEPDPHMRAHLRGKLRRPAEVVDGNAEALPHADASFDTVVSTLVLCSVERPEAVLGELWRVLKPGGKLVFLEHVAADASSSRYAWQLRIEPLWRAFTDGCHLTRRSLESIEKTGFVVDQVKRESMRKAPPIVRPTVRGIAHKPS